MYREPKEIRSTDIKIGMPLVPLIVGNKSNAIITNVINDGVVVVTDFGNEIFYTKTELAGEYGIPYWAGEHMMYYGTNESPINALRERFTTQIEYLTAQVEKLDAQAE